MTDHEPRDQDKPIDVPNAADHRPDHVGAPPWQSGSHDVEAENQNPDAKQPPASQIQKQQRSQGMNHSGWEGKKGPIQK
jgi:hypothetical protein